MNNFDFFEQEQFGHEPIYSSRQFWVDFYRDMKEASQENPEARSQQRQQAHKKPLATDDKHITMSWWAILKVHPADSQADIKTAYRRLARKYHPDCGNMPVGKANEEMRLINAAYEQAKNYFARRE